MMVMLDPPERGLMDGLAPSRVGVCGGQQSVLVRLANGHMYSMVHWTTRHYSGFSTDNI